MPRWRTASIQHAASRPAAIFSTSRALRRPGPGDQAACMNFLDRAPTSTDPRGRSLRWPRSPPRLGAADQGFAAHPRGWFGLADPSPNWSPARWRATCWSARRRCTGQTELVLKPRRLILGNIDGSPALSAIAR
ncbi:MAG: hypothetical protein U0835_06360 [Isosphaeraceae bacterium]